MQVTFSAPCEAGTYKNADMTTCQTCATGKSPSTGSTSCVKIDGTYYMYSLYFYRIVCSKTSCFDVNFSKLFFLLFLFLSHLPEFQFLNKIYV